MKKIKRTLGFIIRHPLGGKLPFKSIFRFLLWQLQSGTSPSKLWVKPFVGRLQFYARKGLTGITGNIYCGLHEFDDMGFLLHFLKAEDTFYDIGANVGSYTLLASGIRDVKSIAVEPTKATFDLLSANIELNNLQARVSLVNAGAGSVPGLQNFSVNQDTTNHVLTEEELKKVDFTDQVAIITVDSLIPQGAPVLIKIDVEGYETEVLRGMHDTLKLDCLKAIIIELNGSGARYGFDEMKIHQLLLSNQFSCFTYDPFKRSLVSSLSYGITNTIYCRDIPYIKERLQNAERLKIMGKYI